MGLAIFVAVGQLNKLFGVPKPEGNTVERFFGVIRELPQTNWASFAVGVLSLALLFLLPRWNKKIPAGLVVLFGTIALSSALDLEGRFGVEVVGTLPQGLPSLALPVVPFETYLSHDSAGHRRVAGRLQRGAGRGARVCRKARLRGGCQPGA